MAKKILPVFTRDHRTGFMKEITHVETKRFALARELATSPPFRVLVADEDETDRRLTIQHLGEAWPFARDLVVECAADAAETLAKIRRNRLEKLHSNRYAFVVLDWNLPQPEGEDVLRAIRGKGLHVPVVVVSGQRREAIASHLEPMAAAFLKKSELNADSFRNAIVAAILLVEGVSGLVRNGCRSIRV